MSSAAKSQWPERGEELSLARALADLDEVEARELDSLLAVHTAHDPQSEELFLAELDLALDGRQEPVPASLRGRLEVAAAEFSATASVSGAAATAPRRAARPTPRASRVPSWVGWAVAAGIAVFAWLGPLGPNSATVDPSGLRDGVLTRATDLKQWVWTGLEDPTVGEVGGDVVWSDAMQEGAMRIQGLAANDPTDFQYQLWIFDKDRDERFPVDGGVFDVPAGASEVIVPIAAKLAVDDAYLFAVTVEVPGGVVVSSRERIAILAQAPQEG